MIISHLLRVAFGLTAAGFAGCLLVAWVADDWRWIVLPVAAPVAAHASIIFAELLLQSAISAREGGASLPVLSMLAATLRELWAAWRAYGWDQAFRSGVHADNLEPVADRRGLVLIHGLFCNRGLWNSWIGELHALRIPFVAVELDPPFASIDAYVAAIDSAICRVTLSTGLPPIVVGHSMGGIAARAWLAARDGESRVFRVLTIGSPHRGTVLSRFSRATNARQMGRASAWLVNLASSERVDAARLFTCFYSRYDNVIIPASSARLPGGRHQEIPRCPHLALVHAPSVLDEVIRLAFVAHESVAIELDATATAPPIKTADGR